VAIAFALIAVLWFAINVPYSLFLARTANGVVSLLPGPNPIEAVTATISEMSIVAPQGTISFSSIPITFNTCLLFALILGTYNFTFQRRISLFFLGMIPMALFHWGILLFLLYQIATLTGSKADMANDPGIQLFLRSFTNTSTLYLLRLAFPIALWFILPYARRVSSRPAER